MGIRFVIFLTSFAAGSFLCTPSQSDAAITFVQEPFAVAYTPNSILANPPPGEERYAGTRMRYSTCTGTAWLPGDRFLAAVNLITGTVQVYEFNESLRTLTPRKAYDNSDGLALDRPENLSFSNDHTLLAIPNMRSGNINIYEVGDAAFVEESPGTPFFVIHDRKAHGARFSPSDDFLAYVSIDDLGAIYVYRVHREELEKPSFELSQAMANAFYPLKPKSIDFSRDGRFVVIGYSEQVSSEQGAARAVLASYAFNAAKGRIRPKPISVVSGLLSAETVQFYVDSSCVFAVDQVADRITGHDFNVETGTLSGTWEALKSPDAQLNFPHGMNFTSDGRFLSVSNYGEDKVTVYEVGN